jgi:hypothetical protein
MMKKTYLREYKSILWIKAAAPTTATINNKLYFKMNGRLNLNSKSKNTKTAKRKIAKNIFSIYSSILWLINANIMK